MQPIKWKSFEFRPQANGLVVVRAISSVQEEIIGTMPWDIARQLADAAPASASPAREGGET